MKRSISRFDLCLISMENRGESSYENPKKSVLIAAPYISNFDLFYALSGFWNLGVDEKFFIKGLLYPKLARPAFQSFGGSGIGINRERRNNLNRHAIDLFHNSKQILLMIPAEGTKKRIEKWKTAFCKGAQGAGLPIALLVLGFLLKTFQHQQNSLLYRSF